MNEGSYLIGKSLTIVEQKGVYQVLSILNARLFHIYLHYDYSCFNRIVRSMIKDILNNKPNFLYCKWEIWL